MTKFVDMPIGKLNRWLAWAQSHDWGATDYLIPWYDDDTGEIVTYGSVYDTNTGQHYREEARHATPHDMKAWDGY